MNRARSIPERIISTSSSFLSVDGPRVQMIFVFFMKCSPSEIFMMRREKAVCALSKKSPDL